MGWDPVNISQSKKEISVKIWKFCFLPLADFSNIYRQILSNKNNPMCYMRRI